MKLVNYFLLSLLCLLGAYFSCYCQQVKVFPNYILGGTIGTNNSGYYNESFFDPGSGAIRDQKNNYKSLTFAIGPYIAKSLSEKSLLGIGLNASHSITKIDNKDLTGLEINKSNSTVLGIRLFCRFVILPEKKLQFYIQPGAGFSHRFGKTEALAPVLIESKSNSYSFNVNCGGIYSINDKWNLLLSIPFLTFSSSKSRNSGQLNATRTNSLSLRPVLNNLQLGIERKF